MRQEVLVDLADTAVEVEDTLFKAHMLCRELCEHYFQHAGKYAGQANNTDEAQQSFIVWEYGHYALYAHIIQDYLLRAEERVAGVSLMLRDYLKHNDRAAATRQA